MSDDCHYRKMNNLLTEEPPSPPTHNRLKQKPQQQQQSSTTAVDDQKKETTSTAATNSTRVFKKCSSNSKVTVYLGKRDFIDHGTHTDIIDGVVLVDPDYVTDRRVFAHVLAAFRYGREDLDVLGLAFRKDLYLSTMQVYPPLPPRDEDGVGEGGGAKGGGKGRRGRSAHKLTSLQERLVKKLGANAYPFSFELPSSSPTSVTLQPAPDDTEKPCGVDYELKAYVTDGSDSTKCHKRSSVSLAIRKLTYARDVLAPQPSAEVSKEFIMSPGSLRMEATLDKEKYYHGESIAVNVLIDNNSHKNVKKIKVQVVQLSDIMLFSKASYKSLVAEVESDEGFPIFPSQTGFCKVYYLTPLLANNRDKRGLALDGQIKHEDTNLASSAILDSNSVKESLGIIVSYRVKIRLILGFGTSDVCLELPFTLTHPKPPATDEDTLSPPSPRPTRPAAGWGGDGGGGIRGEGEEHDLVTLDTDLITIDTNGGCEGFYANQEDDFIFEDFARLRLKGADSLDDTMDA